VSAIGRWGGPKYASPVLIVVALALTACSGTNGTSSASAPASAGQSSQGAPDTSDRDSGDEGTISRQEAIDEHWDDIKDNLAGSEDVQACSSESGNCYTLEADISSGSIDEIHFPKGGDLEFSAEIDSDGNASDTDDKGDSWDFTLDMNSPLVDDAIEDWARSNDYKIQ